MPLFASSRYFSLHDYYPTWHPLLLRSRADKPGQNNVLDIIFYNVFYLEIVTDFDGVAIDLADDEEAARLDHRAHRPARYEHNRYYAIISNEQRYYIGALSFGVEENNLEVGQTSLGMTFDAPKNYDRIVRIDPNHPNPG